MGSVFQQDRTTGFVHQQDGIIGIFQQDGTTGFVYQQDGIIGK